MFVSGILSRNGKGEIVGKGDMAAQIRQVFENIKTALAAAGATMADVVKRQTFTTDIDAYFENIDARMEHGGDNLSTSTTVEVRRLSHPDFLIEVEVMAVHPGELGARYRSLAPSGPTKVTPISPPSRQTTWHSRREPLSPEISRWNWSGTSTPSANSRAPCLEMSVIMQSRGSAPRSVWNLAIRLMV